ncbi:MAG: GNAT family N-acetyltransferase [Pyrinomonadaceae bacterium]
MKQAGRKDKKRVVRILTRSFADDPHARWLVKSEEKGKGRRLKALMNLAFEDALINGEIYLSDDETGAALWKRPGAGGFSFRRVLSRWHFAIAFGWRRTRAVVEMAEYVRKFHPPDDYLYLWFIGVLPEGRGRGNASRLLDPILKKCETEDLPVYLQTANPKNVAIYERKGFTVFHRWSPEDESGLEVWFMRKQGEKAKK